MLSRITVYCHISIITLYIQYIFITCRERHDGKMHDKSLIDSHEELRASRYDENHRRNRISQQVNRDRTNRRQQKVEEMREKAARHSTSQKVKKEKKKKRENYHAKPKTENPSGESKETSWSGWNGDVEKEL